MESIFRQAVYKQAICINDENSYGIEVGKKYKVKELTEEFNKIYYEIVNDHGSVGMYKTWRFQVIKEGI